LQEAKLEETTAKLEAKEEQIKDAMKTVQQVQDMSLERSKEVAKERETLTQDLMRGKVDAFACVCVCYVNVMCIRVYVYVYVYVYVSRAHTASHTPRTLHVCAHTHTHTHTHTG